ncbi:hypothetical protein KC345_g11113, partial [Hortaea werneckii]
ALILPATAGAFGVFLLYQFFVSFPKEIEEAARIDGVNKWNLYARILLPSAVSIMMTLGIFTFMGIYNDFVWPLYATTSPEMRTITAGIAMMATGSYTQSYGKLMAMTTIAALPVLIIFIVGQKSFVKAITSSVKPQKAWASEKSRRIIYSLAAVLLLILAGGAYLVLQHNNGGTEEVYRGHGGTFKNTLAEIDTPDPSVIYRDGYYYMTFTHNGTDIMVMKSLTLDFRQAERKVVWYPPAETAYSANLWAPELQYIRGSWYIYFAAARTTETKEGLFDHRMFVLENDSVNPLEGEWAEKGQIKTAWESFALDGTSFEHKGVRYYVWAQKDPDIEGNSNLYISAMANGWTLTGPQTMISTPEYPWEIIGFRVNEGAAVLKRNGRIFISFSASATDYNYCMGLLTADENSDLLDAASWTKHPEPVFKTSEENGQYGPGHNSFTVDDNGEVVLIYHARNYKEITGDPLYDPNRHTRAQLLQWNGDGTPDFGVPVKDSGK